MAKSPAVLFYTSDFLSGTLTMTDEEVGRYIRLLCLQHQQGHISDKHMKKICYSCEDEVLKKFVQDESGNWYNERMDDEIIKRQNYSQSRTNNRKGKIKVKKHMKNICKSHEKHMENENDNVNTNKNEDKNKYIDPIPFLHETFRNQKFLDAWKNWIDYRVEAKVKNPYYLTSSIGKALNHLRTLSGGSCLQAICLIDLAISKQWQGFYADSPIQIQTNTHTEKPLSMEEASKLTEQFGLKKDKV